MNQPTYRSNLLKDIHDDVQSLNKLGMVSKKTMREFDKLCFASVLPMKGEEIRSLREREGLSQPVFAWHLNVSKNLISDWERGVKNPGGAALKLLNLIREKGLESIVL
jgi:putative transcriptional regulator